MPQQKTCFLFCLTCIGFATTSALAADVTTLMKLMPADLPMLLVVRDMEKLDASIDAFAKNVDPAAAPEPAHAQIRGQLGIGPWIDFSKPVGIAQAEFGRDRTLLLWATVSGFAEKVKQIEGAEESDGVWHLPFPNGEPLFVRVLGDTLVVATNKDTLARAVVREQNLHNALKDRRSLFDERNALIHFNLDSLREKLKGHLAGAAQMAPMMLMMLAQQQPAMDKETIAASVLTLLKSLEAAADQADSIDLFFRVGDKTLDFTVSGDFRDGPIKNYLSTRKPATVDPLGLIHSQPFFAAGGYHMPGEDSPLLDFLFNQFEAATTSVNVAPEKHEKDAGDPAGTVKARKENIQNLRDLHRRAEGRSFVVSASSSGLVFNGSYFSGDPKAVFEMALKQAKASIPILSAVPGIKPHGLGERKIGEITVQEFGLKADAEAGADPALTQLLGKEPRLAIGIAGPHVRFAFGSQDSVDRAFAPIEKPLSVAQQVAGALKSLPPQRNAVLLIDLAAGLPLIGPALGLPATSAELPPGPPIAVSVSVSGPPARIDVHVPAKAIERVIQAAMPPGPS